MDEAIVTAVIFLSVLVIMFVPIFSNTTVTPTFSPDTLAAPIEENIPSDGFIVIEDSDILVYNKLTHIVYYMFESIDESGKSVGYLSPYVSMNGYFCVYFNGILVELYNDFSSYEEEEESIPHNLIVEI